MKQSHGNVTQSESDSVSIIVLAVQRPRLNNFLSQQMETELHNTKLQLTNISNNITIIQTMSYKQIYRENIYNKHIEKL